MGHRNSPVSATGFIQSPPECLREPVAIPVFRIIGPSVSWVLRELRLSQIEPCASTPRPIHVCSRWPKPVLRPRSACHSIAATSVLPAAMAGLARQPCSQPVPRSDAPLPPWKGSKAWPVAGWIFRSRHPARRWFERSSQPFRYAMPSFWAVNGWVLYPSAEEKVLQPIPFRWANDSGSTGRLLWG